MATKNGSGSKVPSTPKGSVKASIGDDGAAKVESPKREPKISKPAKPKEELVVFAFRLTTEEREAIHKAAGPAKASKFVRALARAAAQRDLDGVTRIVEAIEV